MGNAGGQSINQSNKQRLAIPTFVHEMGGEEDDLLPFLPLEQLPDGATGQRVKTGRRLVQHDEFRIA